jgi:hypothetical protein
MYADLRSYLRWEVIKVYAKVSQTFMYEFYLVYACMHVYMCVCMYEDIRSYLRWKRSSRSMSMSVLLIYIYIHTHTHTHTHIQTRTVSYMHTYIHIRMHFLPQDMYELVVSARRGTVGSNIALTSCICYIQTRTVSYIHTYTHQFLPQDMYELVVSARRGTVSSDMAASPRWKKCYHIVVEELQQQTSKLYVEVCTHMIVLRYMEN